MYTFKQLLPLIQKSYGQKCCRKRIADGQTLIVEYGNKIYHGKNNRLDSFVGEWSFGTYSRFWRIVKNDKVLLGGGSSFQDKSMDSMLQKIDFGRLKKVTFERNLDLVLHLDNEVLIEFLSLNHNEESFHIYTPHKKAMVYYTDRGWLYGKTDIPWPNSLNLDF
ncbi:hypothetical protein [Psychrobacter sp. I-STPA6b]|uniref:hypothetical protein n=1 Tax=Psychrobacter sp. I-STPA6b TaxID=2585718 RepID=UPI001D0C619B|nr:hypothetical protein [Psychrobacter sp. I-STPA6b]